MDCFCRRRIRRGRLWNGTIIIYRHPWELDILPPPGPRVLLVHTAPRSRPRALEERGCALSGSSSVPRTEQGLSKCLLTDLMSPRHRKSRTRLYSALCCMRSLLCKFISQFALLMQILSFLNFLNRYHLGRDGSY